MVIAQLHVIPEVGNVVTHAFEGLPLDRTWKELSGQKPPTC